MPYTMRSLDIAVGDVLKMTLPAGMDIIAAGQDGTRPTSGTYADFRIMTDEPIGLRSWEQTDIPEMINGEPTGLYEMRVGQQRVMTVEMQVYGPDAAATAARAALLIEHPLIVYQCSLRGIVLGPILSTLRLPAELTTETEDRWVLQITGAYYRMDALPAPTLAVSGVVPTADIEP